jgi:hypothetical protein
MDWRGDPNAALHALPAIIADLGEHKEPGASEAIAQLEKATTLLRASV